MADLTFASYLQGPLGEAIQATDNMGLLPPPQMTPSVTVTSSIMDPASVPGPPMRLLGPGDVAHLAPGTVVRTEPPAGAADVEPNYMALVEVVPPELPWVLTPAKAANGRLRPWLVLVVLEEATAPITPGTPLPTVIAEIAQLPDLTDSWGWAHIQRTTGEGVLPGGGTASATAVARLVCPRKLDQRTQYRACLVPAFASGRAAGLGDSDAGEAPHDLAWKTSAPEGTTVKLPVHHHWTFTTGESGDFETLMTRLEPADPEALLVSSVRPVDVRSPWPGDKPLADGAQLVGVQGALVPFDAPPIPDPPVSADTEAAFDRRIRAHLDAPARRLIAEGQAGARPGPAAAPPDPDADATGTLAPPLYGGRHVAQDLVAGEPMWLAQLNTSVANRIAAGLGADYVRANQENLMAKAWEQVGAIREANRLRAVVELTTFVAERVHQRHFDTLETGELLAVAAPARERMRTSAETTLAMESRMSRMADGTASSAFARRMRPAGKLARRTGATVRTVIPRALSGDVTVPAGAPVIPPSPTVSVGGLTEVQTASAAQQLLAIDALARVAAVNDANPGASTALAERFANLRTFGAVSSSIDAGSFTLVASAISDQMGAVSELTGSVLADMGKADSPFGAATAFGVPIADTALAGRVTVALAPDDSHRARLATQIRLPERLAPPDPSAPVMACPQFPLPTAMALLSSDKEWFLPGLGAFPNNKVTLLHQNEAFIASYLVGLNHELMRELLWREYPTDQRGTAFACFWPRPDGSPDIAPINTWLDETALIDRLTHGDALSVLLVRGDVIRRYPDMVVTAVPSGAPDAQGHHRPDPTREAVPPIFVIRIDEATVAYAFAIHDAELMTPASPAAPGWFFVFSEHGFRIRFGFDELSPNDAPVDLTAWDKACWPPADENEARGSATVPTARRHAIAGAPLGPVPGQAADAPTWNHDAADVARIALQHPFRVAIQADVLLHPNAGA